MITHYIESFDFFSQFTPYVKCQSQAGELLLSYFQHENCKNKKNHLFKQSSSILNNLLLQKKMGLFPEEKRRYCINMVEICFRSQQVLFKIPRLCTLYNTPAINDLLIPLASHASTVSQEIFDFAAPEKSADRFSCPAAERILKLCLLSLSECKSLSDTTACKELTGVEKLLFKDIVEEFEGYFSLCIQFTHWGLIFPL